MNRLLRIALALIVAFVFAGRMEAAAQHCVRLAQTSAASAEPAEPCPMMGMMAAAKEARSGPAPTSHAHPGAACECMTFAQGLEAPLPALRTTRIAAFAWTRPGAERIASLDLAPDGPPPKA